MLIWYEIHFMLVCGWETSEIHWLIAQKKIFIKHHLQVYPLSMYPSHYILSFPPGYDRIQINTIYDLLNWLIWYITDTISFISADTYPIRYRSDTDPIPIRYQSNTNPIQIRYRSDTDPILIRYWSDTNPIQFQYQFDTNLIPILYHSDTNPIYILIN